MSSEQVRLAVSERIVGSCFSGVLIDSKIVARDDVNFIVRFKMMHLNGDILDHIAVCSVIEQVLEVELITVKELAKRILNVVA